MKMFALMLLLPTFVFAGEKDTIVVDQPDELIVPLQAIEAQGEANREPYEFEDRVTLSFLMSNGEGEVLPLAEPPEYRLIENILVSVLNDAVVSLQLCSAGCDSPFNNLVRLARVTSFQQLTFDRPIVAQQLRVICLQPGLGGSTCDVTIAAFLTPE